MRRYLRPIVIAVAALGLALGVAVGLAVPAQADNALTGGIVSPSPLIVAGTATDPVLTPLVFGGTKDTTSTITGFKITNPASVSEDASSCSGDTSWTCSYTPPTPGFTEGTGNTIEVDYTNSDGSPSATIITFDVVASPESSPAPTPYVAPTVTFTPGAQVTVTPTPAAVAQPGASSETQFYIYEGDGGFDHPSNQGCPDTDEDGYPSSIDEVPTCTVTLDPDTWLAESQQAANSGDSPAIIGNPVYTVFSIEEAPLLDPDTSNPAITQNSDNSVTIHGLVEGAPDADVVVYDQNGAVACETPVGDGGDFTSWQCQTAPLTAGTHTFAAAERDNGDGEGIAERYGYYYLNGALSDLTTMGTVVVAAPVVPAGPTTTGDTTPNWSFTIGGDLTNIHPGDSITISGTGLPVGTSLDTILHSVPTDLGTVAAAADGTFTQTATIPDGTELGDHTILVTASGPGITTSTKQQAITVTAVPQAASSSSGKTGVIAPAPTATHGNGGSANGTGIAPNILTRALTPLADVAIHPNKIISAFEIGLVLLLLAVLPAHLLNATIAEQTDRFEKRFGKAKAPNWLFRLGLWFKSAPVAGGIVVTLATAILFGFADPKFGFTLASLRLILACGIALFLVGYVANALTGVIARVQWNVMAAVSTRPYGLILTIVGVLVSRLLHFSPGFLIGLILGLTIQGKSAPGYAWRTIVVRTSIVLAMAVAAWIGYSTLTLGGNEGGTFGSELLVETLVAITTEGIVALLVELLPLRFLEGQRIYDHSRVLWGILYVLTLVVFVLAVVPWEGNWDALHGSLGVWIIVLAAFAVVCVGIYIFFRRFMPPTEEEDGDEEVPLGETVAREHK
jgi:hypothetical protein